MGGWGELQGRDTHEVGIKERATRAQHSDVAGADRAHGGSRWLRRFDACGAHRGLRFVSTDWKPGYLRSGPTNVVVQLGGDPVSVQEDHAGRHFAGAEKQAATAALAASQDAIRPAIEALGGTVIGDYQLAYNGLKVNIDARQLTALAALPNVIGVHKLQKMEPVRPENVNGVQLIGAPAAWASAGKYTGKGIKVAVIDTGIDYTHAELRRAGHVAAYAAANATDTLPANPMWFGPTAFTKVKGGTDLVGDNYNADGTGAAADPGPGPEPARLQRARLARRRLRGRLRRPLDRRHVHRVRTTRRRTRRTRSGSVRAPRPRPSCTASGSSAAPARPT